MKQHLFLVGYRGCGKSLIGRLVAAKLGRNAIDSDDAIEQLAGMTIREIFSDVGESGFRDLECQTIDHIASNTEPFVVALGGGAVLRAENRKRMSETGHTVWLQALPETIARRIAADANTAARRPALTQLATLDEIVFILSVREPLYREVAQFAIATDDREPEAIAEEICHWFKTASRDLVHEST